MDISVENIKEAIVPVSAAICAFSVWRNTQSKCSYRSQTINLCSMVHGFDIPLNDKIAFNNAVHRSTNTLNDLNVEITPIKTNFRELSKVTWVHSFACALVATLSNFKSVAGTCIVGSSEPYDSLIIPWGSSPITEHLLSSGEFNAIHDGACHSRTEKVAEIKEWETSIQNLRVCREGDLKDRNCGICEKCMRTKLNFLAIKADIPSAFPTSDIMKELNNVVLKSDLIKAEWLQIYETAVNNGVKDAWVKKIPSVIEYKPVLEKILPRFISRRKLIKN